MSASHPLTVALVGNPNSGKTSLFNQLTGLHHKVGNFPGVTVDRVEGECQLYEGASCKIIDLPGTYSLHPKSLEEKVVTETLLSEKSEDYPDLVLLVIDETNLKRNLFLLTQVLDLRIPVVVALNMVEEAAKLGLKPDPKALHRRTGIPFVEINARSGEGLIDLKKAILEGGSKSFQSFFEPGSDIKSLYKKESDKRPSIYSYYMEVLHSEELLFLDAQKERLVQIKNSELNSIQAQKDETIKRYRLIDELIAGALPKGKEEDSATTLTQKIDNVLVHPFWGYLIFLVVLAVVFQTVYTLASYPMDWIDQGMGMLSNWVGESLPEGDLSALVTDGILAGIGGVVIFIPQIAFLFLVLSVLEESGYMARVVFLMDKIMRKFGMSGRSVVPLVSAVACAIPAVMATRTISNWKERMITIFVTPFMSCSARLPVYAILIALIVPEQNSWGPFNVHGILLLAMYAFGFIVAVLTGWIMKLVLKSKEASYLVMELPTYRIPNSKNIFQTCYEKSRTFVFEAGKIILAVSIVLWALASYGPGEGMDEAEKLAQTEAKTLGLDEHDTENLVASYKLEASYAGHFGQFIEPAIEPLGYDWKIGVALFSSFAAREVFVGTISTIYSMGSEPDDYRLKTRLAQVTHPKTGEPVFTLATSISLLIFYALAMQCMSTIAIVYRETTSWKWAMGQMLYMTGLAWLGSFIAFQLLS